MRKSLILFKNPLRYYIINKGSKKKVFVIDTIKFSSIKELYQRVEPALLCKTDELKRKGYKFIKKEDVWNALKNNKWNSAQNLSLHDIVDDILNTPDEFFTNYFQTVFKNLKRDINLEENIL